MQYEIYTDEILKVHCSYFVEAESKDEARAIFEEQRKNGNYDEEPLAIVVTSDTLDLQSVLDNY